MNDDILDLLAKLDDDALAPEEHARLLDTLKADPEARRTLVMHYMIGAGTGRLARAKSARLARPNRLVFPSRRLLRPVLAAAAALLIVVGIWIANRQPSSAATEWRLADTEGRLVVTRDGRTFAAASGTFLQDGDRLAAHDAARATLMLEDTSTGSARFLLSQTAVLTVSADKHAPRLRLESGRLEALVEPRTTAQPLTIETLHAELTVLGTRFIALSDSHSTRARVTEGRIRMTRLSDGQSVEIEADHYAVATADLGRLPHGPYTPGMNVEGGIVFRETFEQGWRPEIWETAYFDKKEPRRLPGNPLGPSVGITSETHGHPSRSQALEIRANGPAGSRTTVWAPLRNIRLPDSFVMEFDIFHVRPSNPAYIETGGVGEILYENPRALAMRNQHLRDRQWWRARFETRLYQTEDGLWNAEQHEFMNGVRLSHRRYTAIRHPHSFQRPLFLFFALNSGHIKLADAVMYEWTPFDAEPAPPNPTIFRESFAQGWRPHVWQTALFDPTTRQTRVEDLLGRNVFVTTDTRDPNRSHALEIKEDHNENQHILLRIDPRLILFPARFVMEFDVFHHAPSEFGFLDMGGTKETLYSNPNKVHMQARERKKKAWWTTRLEFELAQAPDGTRIADVVEHMNGERVLHTIISDIRDQDSFSPPDVVFFSLESGHVMLDNLHVYANPAPNATLVQADRETDVDK